VGEVLIKRIEGPFDVYGIGEKNEIVLEVDKCPAIFRKMQWWEKRDLSEMPKYLIVVSETINDRSWKGIIVKCGEEIFWNSNEFSIDKNGFIKAYGGIVINCFAPATQQEYEAYLKQSQK
jgi:hypothetical protein